MSEDISPEELLELLRLRQEGQAPAETLEQMLYRMILNPVKSQQQKIRLSPDLADEVFFEVREGTLLNEDGQEEEIQELIINAKSLADGSPMNIYGLVYCQACGSLVREESLTRCARCLRVICIAPGCAHFSRRQNAFFCSAGCKLLSALHL